MVFVTLQNVPVIYVNHGVLSFPYAVRTGLRVRCGLACWLPGSAGQLVFSGFIF